MKKTAALAENIQNHWNELSHLFSIHNEEAYDKALELLASLLDEIGTHKGHPLYEFLIALGTVIHAYEEKNYPTPLCTSTEMLRFFMREQELSLSDLPEIGSDKVIIDILNGKQELTLRNIRALSEKFHVRSEVFI